MEKVPEYCLLWIQWSPVCMPRSDWASWVQAVGSIVAILASAGIVFLQNRVDGRRRKRDLHEGRIAWAELCIEVVDDALRLMRDTEEKFDEQPANIGSERVEEALVSLRAIESRGLPAELLAEMLAVKRELAFTLTAIRQYQARIPVSDRALKAARRASTVERVKERLRIALARYRSDMAKSLRL